MSARYPKIDFGFSGFRLFSCHVSCFPRRHNSAREQESAVGTGPHACTRVRMFNSSVAVPLAISARPSPRPGHRASRAAIRRSPVAMAGDGDASPSFVGMWRREGEKSVGAVEYLQAHGLSPAKAAERALAPYQQEWRETGNEAGEFLVLTDPGTGRGVRSLVYPLGEWEEPFEGDCEHCGNVH